MAVAEMSEEDSHSPRRFSNSPRQVRSHVEPEEEPARLAQWETYYTETGKPYYYHPVTGITQWERPAELVPPAPAAGSGSSETGAPLNVKTEAPVLPACQPLGTDPGKAGPAGANLFIFYLPPSWSEPELFAAFQAYGTIISARVQRDTFGRSRGYGFVSYDSAEAAMAAIRGMDGAAVGGKRLKVSVKKGEASADSGFGGRPPGFHHSYDHMHHRGGGMHHRGGGMHYQGPTDYHVPSGRGGGRGGFRRPTHSHGPY